MGKNAQLLLREDLRREFQRREQHLIFLNYAIILAVVLFFAWPKRYYYEYMQTATLPLPYDVLSMAVFIMVGYLGFAALSRTMYERDYHSISDWLRFTPISALQLLAGKCLLQVVSVAWLLMLSLPLLTLYHLSLGFDWQRFAATLAVLFVSLATYRLMGLLIMAVLEPYEEWIGRISMLVYISVSFGTAFAAPKLNVLSALVALNRPESPNPPWLIGSVRLSAPLALTLVHLLSGLAVAGLLALWFWHTKRKAQAHA